MAPKKQKKNKKADDDDYWYVQRFCSGGVFGALPRNALVPKLTLRACFAPCRDTVGETIPPAGEEPTEEPSKEPVVATADDDDEFATGGGGGLMVRPSAHP